MCVFSLQDDVEAVKKVKGDKNGDHAHDDDDENGAEDEEELDEDGLEDEEDGEDDLDEGEGEEGEGMRVFCFIRFVVIDWGNSFRRCAVGSRQVFAVLEWGTEPLGCRECRRGRIKNERKEKVLSHPVKK